MNTRWKTIATIAFPVLAGSIAGALANKSSRQTYEKLETPDFAPPGWVFPIAWTTLYATVGVAKYKFDQSKKAETVQKTGDAIYATQLSLNYIWSFLFFKYKLRGTALLDAILLWLAVLINGYYFQKSSKQAGALFIPYASWVSFAIALNYATWQLNRAKMAEGKS